MKLEFQPDIFSNAHPSWTQLPEVLTIRLHEVTNQLCADHFQARRFEQIGALEINSSNFRVTSTENRHYLLKSWTATKEKSQLERQLTIITWLNSRGLKVVAPLSCSGGGFCQLLDGKFWAVFPFCEGAYFSGHGRQLHAALESMLDLHLHLAHLPPELWPSQGPDHLTLVDRKTLIEMGEKRSEWPALLGDSIASLLHSFWPDVIEAWDRTFKLFPKFHHLPVHYDLHPHNILMQDDHLVAMLDFDSCSVMNPGVGIAFAALKLGRQTMVIQPTLELINIFFTLLASNEQVSRFIPHLRELACAEVLRRIAIILRLSQNGDQRWNHVLPIQLQHLKECDYFFGDRSYTQL